MAKVRVIPSTINPLTLKPLSSNLKRKVAAYARVSTDSDEQASSYDAQVEFYKHHIQEKPDWEYVDVYADEGISGTNTKKRDGFLKMIKDAMSGKINLILTKSISRFARNTLDTISYIRKLKSAGVEVYFEKENIWTFDSKSEMVLSMLAAIAQEESRSISENVKIGIRWRYNQGKVSMPYKKFIGYDKVDGRIVVVEEQAEVIRKIYKMFLRDGMSRSAIANKLNEDNVPKFGSETKWTMLNINSILTNEKYKGDALLQKVYVDNYLDHNVKKNDGVLPQYYVENSHPAIIDKNEWNMVQDELKRREKFKYSYSNKNDYSSKLICGCCGHFYGPKVWHSTDKYRSVTWQCNKKFKNKCDTPNLSGAEINTMFIEAYNSVMVDKEALIITCEDMIEYLTDTSEIDKAIDEATQEMKEIEILVNSLIKDNANRSQSQEEYQVKYNEYSERFSKAKGRLEKATSEKLCMKEKADSMICFIKEIQDEPSVITKFDPVIWNTMLEQAVVNKDSSITFKFKNGVEKTIKMKKDKKALEKI